MNANVKIDGRIRTSFGLSFEVVSRFVKQQKIAYDINRTFYEESKYAMLFWLFDG